MPRTTAARQFAVLTIPTGKYYGNQNRQRRARYQDEKWVRRGSSRRRSWFVTGTMVEIFALLTLSTVAVLSGLIAAGWLLFSGEFTSFDGLLLTSVALLLVVIFSLNALWTIRSQEFQRWWDGRQRGKNKENQVQEKQIA